MKNTIKKTGLFSQIITSVRIVLSTMAICCLLYTLLILGIGQTFVPFTANGSLICNENKVIIGSKLIAQQFSRPEYFWPRPSAVSYNASASGGSNLSPTNRKLRKNAEAIINKLGVTAGNLIPADLVTASGSGLDPDITLSAARFQAARVASARHLPITIVMDVIEKHAKLSERPFTSEPSVNVLIVNMALERLDK